MCCPPSFLNFASGSKILRLWHSRNSDFFGRIGIVEYWYHHYQLVNVGKPALDVIEHLQLVFIELKKFPVSSKEEKRLRLLWLRFLREINDKTREVSADFLGVPEICQAIELAQESAYNEVELNAYEDYWNAVSTEKTLMSGKYREGEEKGRKEGEEKERHRVARQMKEQGISTALISICTRLSEKSIDSL